MAGVIEQLTYCFGRTYFPMGEDLFGDVRPACLVLQDLSLGPVKLIMVLNQLGLEPSVSQ